MADLVLERAKESDLTAIFNLMVANWEQIYLSPDDIPSSAQDYYDGHKQYFEEKNDRDSIFLLKDGENIIGITEYSQKRIVTRSDGARELVERAYQPSEGETVEERGYLGSFIIEKDYRKKGHGREFFNKITSAINPEVESIHTAILDENKNAKSFFERLEFKFLLSNPQNKRKLNYYRFELGQPN